METAASLVEFCREGNRVCPQPTYWNELWEMLPNRIRVGAGWEPPLPLILGAWWETSSEEKALRLETHIQWAERHGVLDAVSDFLRSYKGTFIALMHSELSECLEGERKDLMDDKLPHRKMAEVELADTVIRIADYCGLHGYDLEGAIIEKLAYNRVREDHKQEIRDQQGGKKF